MRICSVPSLLLFMTLTDFSCPESGVAQDRGIIDCEAGKSIPAWSEPDSTVEVRQISCGRIVGILAMERNWIKIQITEEVVAYVKAQYVRLPQIQGEQPARLERRVAELEAQVKELQRQPSSPPAVVPVEQKEPLQIQQPTVYTAQPGEPKVTFPKPHQEVTEEAKGEYPKAELFAGYTLVHLLSGNGNLDGWNTAITGDVNSAFGLKAEFSGIYGKDSGYSDFHYSGYSFMAGPQVKSRRSSQSVAPFVHALIGVEHLGGSLPLFSGIRGGASLNAFAMALGGGLDWGQKNSVGLILPQIDYFPWRALGSTGHNFRISAGFVFRFY